MTPILLSVITFCSSLFGGTIAIKNQKRLHYILGFTAGVILGLVAFDILPEIFKLAEANSIDTTTPMIALVIGFLLFHVIERALLMHHAHEGEYGEHHHPIVGVASALAFCFHSFLDGVGIGLGFQVSTAVGFTVAIAVISHAFVDGMNTISLSLGNKNSVLRSKLLLVMVASAPILGAVFASFIQLSETYLVIYLGLFAGFLLYIGASDILPQAHEKNSSYLTIGLTIFGALLMFAITRLI
jgi:zinc transporter ZupT